MGALPPRAESRQEPEGGLRAQGAVTALSGPPGQALLCSGESGFSLSHKEVEAEDKCLEVREAALGLQPVSSAFLHLTARASSQALPAAGVPCLLSQ